MHAHNDFLHGSAAIAAYWGELTGQSITPKAAREMIYAGKLPAGRLGGRLIGSKDVIREHLDAIARGIQPAPLPLDQMPAASTAPEPAGQICKACGESFVFERPPGRSGRPPTRCSGCIALGKRAR